MQSGDSIGRSQVCLLWLWPRQPALGENRRTLRLSLPQTCFLYMMGNMATKSYWASQFWHQRMVESFPLVPCEKLRGKISIGQVLTTAPVSYGLCAGLGQVAQTWPLTPFKYIEAFPRGNGIILSQAATPIDVCFNCIVLYCQDICKSDVISAELCRRMSLRHCQVVEPFGRKSQRHRHLERKWRPCVSREASPWHLLWDFWPAWALKNHLAQPSVSRLVNL